VERVARFDPDLSFGTMAAKAEDRPTEKITSKQLKRFLEHPVRQKIQRHLGFYDEEETLEDVVLLADEPFFSEFPVDYHLKMDPIKLWIEGTLSGRGADAGTSDPEALYHLVYDACRRKSQTPEGAFADIDRDEIVGHVRQLAETLNPVLEQMKSAKQVFQAVSIGSSAGKDIPSNSGPSLKRFDPLSLTVETLNSASETVTREVEISGQWPWVWQDADDTWHTLILTGSGKRPGEPDRYVLEPVLLYLMCLAGGESDKWIASSGITLHVAYRETMKEWSYRFDPKVAEAYLTELASDILDRSKTAWLPFDIVTDRKLSVKPHKMREDDIDDDTRRQFAAEIEDAFAEEEDYLIRIVKPVVPPDALHIVRRRLEIYFDRE